MRTQRRIQVHLGEFVVVALFVATLLGGLGVNAFLTGQPVLFGGYGYGPPGSPDAPQDVTADGGDQTVTVAWSAPADEGASPITGYNVYLSAGGNLVDTAFVEETVFTHQFAGLTNGTEYTVHVAAVNAVGQGPTSTPATATPTSVPSQPTITSLVPGDEQVTVNWAAPVDDGGLPLTGYTVSVTPPTGAPAVTPQNVGPGVTTAVFSGLLNQQTYTFTVAAANAEGTGASSAPVSAAPNGPIVPGQPLINAAVPGNGSVTVHWTAPTSNGGSAITGYTITITPAAGGAAVATVQSATSPVTITGLVNGVAYNAVVKAENIEGFGPDSQPKQFTPSAPVVTPAAPPPGYWLAALDGGVFAFGNRDYFGSMAGKPLNGPVIAMASTPDGGGYWLVGSDGGVFAFGNAPFFGSALGLPLVEPIVGIAVTPDGQGYWLVAADGGVFAFGNAPFLGGVNGLLLADAIVGIAGHPSGQGYWLVGADGGVFAFGSAGNFGNALPFAGGNVILGMIPTADGGGYWLVGFDGGVFAFGSAPFYGSLVGFDLSSPVIAIARRTDGPGYFLAGLDGGVFGLPLGSPFYGSMFDAGLVAPVVAIA